MARASSRLQDPAKVAIPNCVGLTVRDAIADCRAAGVLLTADDDGTLPAPKRADRDKVIESQDPPTSDGQMDVGGVIGVILVEQDAR